MIYGLLMLVGFIVALVGVVNLVAGVTDGEMVVALTGILLAVGGALLVVLGVWLSRRAPDKVGAAMAAAQRASAQRSAESRAYYGGVGLDVSKPDTKWSRGWVVMAAYGWPIRESSSVELVVTDAALCLGDARRVQEPRVIEFTQLHELEIGGPGLTVTDAGIIGGGFGFWGAVQGMAIAAALNSASRQEDISTLLQIRAEGGGVLLHTSQHVPERLEQDLGVAFGALAARRAVGLTPRPNDLAEQLERLARLFEEGSLTQAEYDTAKARLLDS